MNRAPRRKVGVRTDDVCPRLLTFGGSLDHLGFAGARFGLTGRESDGLLRGLNG
jgi:hypothetical protein